MILQISETGEIFFSTFSTTGYRGESETGEMSLNNVSETGEIILDPTTITVTYKPENIISSQEGIKTISQPQLFKFISKPI